MIADLTATTTQLYKDLEAAQPRVTELTKKLELRSQEEAAAEAIEG